jgi:excisionase family DNA binding protein
MSQQPLTTAAEPEELKTVKQAAKLLGVSVSTVWVLIRNEQLASVEIPSATGEGKRSTRRIEPAEITAFIARNRAGTPAAATA